jgi:hypothetical protein
VTAGSQLIDAYLGDVAAALPGPARARTDIVAELRSGLLDAVEAYRSAGLPPAPAAEAAIREFGDASRIAAGLHPELAAHQARRLASALVATGPLIGLLWATAALASHIGIRPALPWQWAGAPPASMVAFPVAAAALLITVWTALFTLAATGRPARWLPIGPRMAATTAAMAGFGAMVADAAVFVLLASQLFSAPSRLAPAPIAVAAAASLTRLTLARRGARRCLSARATLA